MYDVYVYIKTMYLCMYLNKIFIYLEPSLSTTDRINRLSGPLTWGGKKKGKTSLT